MQEKNKFTASILINAIKLTSDHYIVIPSIYRLWFFFLYFRTRRVSYKKQQLLIFPSRVPCFNPVFWLVRFARHSSFMCWLSSYCVLYPMLPVSLDCSFDLFYQAQDNNRFSNTNPTKNRDALKVWSWAILKRRTLFVCINCKRRVES
jgi:hypothetical protein